MVVYSNGWFSMVGRKKILKTKLVKRPADQLRQQKQLCVGCLWLWSFLFLGGTPLKIDGWNIRITLNWNPENHLNQTSHGFALKVWSFRDVNIEQEEKLY